MKIKSVRYAGKMDVYNMEVADTHDFVVQGGVISHNCADETRYFLMSRPIKPKTVPPPNMYKQSPMWQYLAIDQADVLPPAKIHRMEIIDNADE